MVRGGDGGIRWVEGSKDMGGRAGWESEKEGSLDDVYLLPSDLLEDCGRW